MRMIKDDENKSFHLTNAISSKNHQIDAIGILAYKYNNKTHFNYLMSIKARYNVFGYFVFLLGTHRNEKN